MPSAAEAHNAWAEESAANSTAVAQKSEKAPLHAPRSAEWAAS